MENNLPMQGLLIIICIELRFLLEQTASFSNMYRGILYFITDELESPFSAKVDFGLKTTSLLQSSSLCRKRTKCTLATPEVIRCKSAKNFARAIQTARAARVKSIARGLLRLLVYHIKPGAFCLAKCLLKFWVTSAIYSTSRRGVIKQQKTFSVS